MKMIKTIILTIYKPIFLAFFITGSIFCFGQANTTIYGKIIDKKNESITITTDNFSFYKRSTVTETMVDENGNFCFKFYLKEPTKLSLFNSQFYIKPHDSVYINVQENSWEILGSNADNYRYSLKFDSLTSNLEFKYYRYDFKCSMNNYLDSVKINRNNYLNLLESLNSGGKISEDFYAYALSQIEYNFYNQLFFPIISKNYSIGLLPESYTSILDQIKLKNDKLVKEREYGLAAINLIVYKNNNSNFSKLELIMNNSNGLTRELLLTDYAYKLMNNYTSKQNLQYSNIFKQIKKEISDPEFMQYFKVAEKKLEKYENMFSIEVLNSELIDTSGKKITFKELLELSRGKGLVLDFWASWCGPCLHGIPFINELSSKYKGEIGFVFISLDKTTEDWQIGLNKIAMSGNHYLIKDNFKSALARYLDILTIPRYVIINSDGKLENMDARSPSEGIWLDKQIHGLLDK